MIEGFRTDATMDDLELAYLDPDAEGGDLADAFLNWSATVGDDEGRVALRGWVHQAKGREHPDGFILADAWLERMGQAGVPKSKRATAGAFTESGEFGERGEQVRAVSISRLAEDSGKGHATVERFLAWAKADGWIVPTGNAVRFYRGKRTTPLYRLTTPDMLDEGLPEWEPLDVMDWPAAEEFTGIAPIDQWWGLTLDDLEK